MQSTDTPKLVETKADLFGEYEERWMVEPPPKGVTYFVTEAVWTSELRVRTIFAWERAYLEDRPA